MLRMFLVATAVVLATPILADPPEITDVQARKAGNTWSFSVTLLHGDTGWDDYADGWRVVDLEGSILGTRVLAHPHVNEQPFTRSLSGVKLTKGQCDVWVEARTNTGNWPQAPLLPARERVKVALKSSGCR